MKPTIIVIVFFAAVCVVLGFMTHDIVGDGAQLSAPLVVTF